MDYLLRLPKFPIIVDLGDELLHARSPGELERKLAKVSSGDEVRRRIIDSSAEGFVLYPKKMIVLPGIAKRRWTKAEIIELYNSRKKPEAPEFRTTSLGSKRLEQVVLEAIALLAKA